MACSIESMTAANFAPGALRREGGTTSGGSRATAGEQPCRATGRSLAAPRSRSAANWAFTALRLDQLGQVRLFVLSAQARWTICKVRSTMGSGTPDVRLTGVTKRFGDDIVAVDRIDLDVTTASSWRCSGPRAAARRRRCG